MLKDDQIRLEREAALAKSVQGPDYTLLKKQARAAYADWDNRDAAALRVWQQHQHGYYEAAKRGEVQRINGKTPSFNNTAPGFRTRNHNTGWCMR